MNPFKLTPLQFIGIVLVINGALIGSTAQLTDLFGEHAAHVVISIASLGNSIFGGIVTMMSGQGAMIKNVAAMPGIESIKVNSLASPTLAAIAVDPGQDKIAPTPQAESKVVATAKSA